MDLLGLGNVTFRAGCAALPEAGERASLNDVGATADLDGCEDVSDVSTELSEAPEETLALVSAGFSDPLIAEGGADC